MNVLIVDWDLGEVVSASAGAKGCHWTAQFDRARDSGADGEHFDAVRFSLSLGVR
jgi:hypothetical protein